MGKKSRGRNVQHEILDSTTILMAQINLSIDMEVLEDTMKRVEDGNTK